MGVLWIKVEPVYSNMCHWCAVMLKSLIIPLGQQKRAWPRDLVVKAHPARPPHSLPILVNLLGHHIKLVTSTHTHSSLPQPGTFSQHPSHPPHSLPILTSLLRHHIRLFTSTHTHSSLPQPGASSHHLSHPPYFLYPAEVGIDTCK
jgi:hypothetical protein